MGAIIKPWSDSLEESFCSIEAVLSCLKFHTNNQFDEEEINQANFALEKIKKIAFKYPRFAYQQWQQDIDDLYYKDPTIGGIIIKLSFSKSSSPFYSTITYKL